MDLDVGAVKRSSYATITATGRSRLRAAAPSYLSAIESYFAAHLSHEELTLIGTALATVVAVEE